MNLGVGRLVDYEILEGPAYLQTINSCEHLPVTVAELSMIEWKSQRVSFQVREKLNKFIAN